MYFTQRSCGGLDDCPFFEKSYWTAMLSSLCKVHLPGHLSAKGECVVANVTLKGNWQEGSFSEIFQACALFCHPLSLLTCHACKCCPVIGHCVLTNFISTNWTKVIGVMLKVLVVQKNSMCNVWTFHYTFPHFPPSLLCLSQLIAFSYGPSKPTTLVPTSPIQLPAGSQWGASKWGSDYQFPGRLAESRTTDRCHSLTLCKDKRLAETSSIKLQIPSHHFQQP